MRHAFHFVTKTINRSIHLCVLLVTYISSHALVSGAVILLAHRNWYTVMFFFSSLRCLLHLQCIWCAKPLSVTCSRCILMKIESFLSMSFIRVQKWMMLRSHAAAESSRWSLMLLLLLLLLTRWWWCLFVYFLHFTRLCHVFPSEMNIYSNTYGFCTVILVKITGLSF